MVVVEAVDDAGLVVVPVVVLSDTPAVVGFSVTSGVVTGARVVVT